MLYNPLFFFSDWIIICFIFYKLGIIKYNPKIVILLGICENIFWLAVIFRNTKKFKMDNVLVIHFIIKILMLFSLENSVIAINDLNLFIILYIIYNFWLKKIHNQTIIEHYKIRIDNYKKLDLNN